MNINNDSIQLQLKKRVEQIVRPVVAPHERKMQMRYELLAHLSELYEQECERQGDPQLAIARATDRLGDPAEIRRQLKDTVSTWETWSRVAVRQPGQTVLRCALRDAGAFALGGIALGLIWLLIVQALNGGPWPGPSVSAAVLAAFAAIGLACCFVLHINNYPAAEPAIESATARSVRAAAKALVVAGGLLAYALAMVLAVSLRIPGSAGFWVWVASIAWTIWFALYAARRWQESRQELDWTRLIID